jgi:hypothetical protein
VFNHIDVEALFRMQKLHDFFILFVLANRLFADGRNRCLQDPLSFGGAHSGVDVCVVKCCVDSFRQFEGGVTRFCKFKVLLPVVLEHLQQGA